MSESIPPEGDRRGGFRPLRCANPDFYTVLAVGIVLSLIGALVLIVCLLR